MIQQMSCRCHAYPFLTIKEHIHDKINKAYAILGLIKQNFTHLTTSGFMLLYKNMIRSHLEYCNSVWSPYRKYDIEAVEKVQKRSYEDFVAS